MSRFFELRLVDFVTRSKSATKRKQDASKPDVVEMKTKRNRKESICNMSMPTVTEQMRTKSKSRVISRPSKKAIQNSHQQLDEEIKNSTMADCPKLNISGEGCGSNENKNLFHPKFGCQVTASLVSGAKKLSSQIKSKTLPTFDVINVMSNVKSLCTINEGFKNKKPKKRKSHQKFWESNLTGARRVSKRLTNLKIKNKNASKPQTTSEKYIFTNISHSSSNPEKLTRAQGSVFMSVPQKKLKMNRSRKTVKKSPTTKHQSKVLSAYGKTSQKKQMHPKVFVSDKKINKQKRPNFAELHLLKGANTFFESESTLRSNSINICGRKDDKLSTASTSAAVLESTTEEVSGSSSVDKEEGANNLVHTDLEIKKTEDLYQSIEENGFSENKTDIGIQNTTATVIHDEIHKECEENTDIIRVNIETEKEVPSNVSEGYGNKVASEYTAENDKEGKEETIGSTFITEPCNLKCSDENDMASLELDTDSVSESSVIIEKLKLRAKMD